jgi:hypothetical protein
VTTIPAPTSTTRHYKAPAVEDSDEDKGPSRGKSESEHAPSAPAGSRKIKAHKKKQKKTATTEEEGATRSSPKRQLDEEDIPEMQAMVKRTKLTSISKEAEKRKSDVSMVDAGSAPPPSPPDKRQKRQQLPETETVPAVHIEYEDITAEVDARMQQRHERKEHERKQELGIIDKRKRQSNDSFTVDLVQEGKSGHADKPSRKRKKHRHSAQAEGANDG